MATEIEQLYRDHRAGLVRLVERELHDHHEAEDVVQTAFLDAQRALDRGTTPRNPRAWLAAIALNAGRRLRRRRLNTEPLEDYAVQAASGIPEIRAALASLPREQRAAVVYRDVLGFSYGETAERMGKSVDAVTMLLHRGRKHLRQAVGVIAGGIGLWRWLKRAVMPQLAVAKSTAAVVVAAGLATSGAFAARVISSSVGSDVTAAAAATRSGNRVEKTRRAPGSGLTVDPTPRRPATTGASRTGATPVSTLGAAAASAQGATAGTSSAAADSSTVRAATSLLPSTLRLPAVSVPTLSVPETATTLTVNTPVTTVTLTTPSRTTATLATPIATVTLPIP